MNLKKILSGIAALSVATLATVSAANYADTAGHWAEQYLDTAIEEGVIDSSKTNFRPNANINRAELTKIVVNYDNGGEDATAADYLSPANYSDVSASAWYYHTVNYAAEEGIVDASKTTFRPADAINRAEAVKVITLALEVPSVDVTLPFTDVNSSDWFYPYVKNAYGNCIVNGRTASQFQPAEAITRAEAIKVFVKSLNPGCATTPATTSPMTTSPATTSAVTTAPTTPDPSATTDAEVEIVISSMSPASQSVPTNAYNVPFIAIDITASNDEDLLLSGLNIQHTGLGDADEVQNVQIFEGYIPRGNSKDFSGEGDVATLNLISDAVTIPAGTTKTVYVRADLGATTTTGSGATSGGEHAMAILTANDITLVGATTGAIVQDVTGSFPLVGETMKVANIFVGEIDVTLESVADTSVESGTTDVEVARIKMDANNAEDVYLRALTIEVNGTLDDGDVRNFYAEVDDVRVSNIVAQANNDFVTFDMTAIDTAGVLIEDSSTEYIRIYADLTGPIENFGSSMQDLIIDIDEESDIVAIGAKYGFGVKKVLDTANYAATTSRYIDVVGGDITFSFDSTSTDVAEGTDNVVFGTLVIDNKAETIEIDKSISFSLEASNGALPDDLENIKLVAVSNGVTILGPVDVSTTATVRGTTATPMTYIAALPSFGDDFIIGAGQVVEFHIVADVKDDTPTDAQFKFGLDMDSIFVTGQVSDSDTGFDIKPSADGIATGSSTTNAGTEISTDLYTVKAAGVTAVTKPLTDDNYVESTDDAEVWYGTLRANDVKDIKVTRLAFVNNGTATGSDLVDYTVQAKVNGEWQNVETGVSAPTNGTEFTFTDLDELSTGDLMIDSGEEIEIRVLVDVADTIVALNTIELELVVANSLTQEIETDGSLGDDLDLTNTANVPSNATFTLVKSGSLEVTLDTSKTPDTALLVAGNSTPTEVAVYELDAKDEDINLEELTVLITDTSFNPGVTSTLVEEPIAIITQNTAPVGATVDTSTVTIAAAGSIGISDTFELRDSAGVLIASYTPASGETTREEVITGFIGSTPAAGYTIAVAANGSTISMDVSKAGETGTPSLTRTPNADSNDNFTATPFANTPAIAEVCTINVSNLLFDSAASLADDITVTLATAAADTVTVTRTATGYALTPGTITTPGITATISGSTVTVTGSAAASNVPENACGAPLTTVVGTPVILSDLAATTTPTGSTGSANVVSNANVTNRSSVSLTNAFEAIHAVHLMYEDGTPVKKTNGANAVIVGIDSNKAFFEDLDLMVSAGDEVYLSVRVELNDIDDNDVNATAVSGHAFNVELLVDGDDGKAKGIDSGDELLDGLSLLDDSDLNSIVLNASGDDTREGNDFLVTNNHIIATVTGVAQPTSLVASPNTELMKFKLTDLGDTSDEAGVNSVILTVTPSDTAAIPLVEADIVIVNDEGLKHACIAYVPVSPVTAGNVICDFTILGEVIDGGAEVYTVEVDYSALPGAIPADSTVNTQVAVNGAIPGTDGITWQDGGDGTNPGVGVQWIDLGESGSAAGVTKIENTIRN